MFVELRKLQSNGAIRRHHLFYNSRKGGVFMHQYLLQTNSALFASKHYDTTLENQTTIYDNLPYKRDRDLCNAEQIRQWSGNIIKASSVTMQIPYTINNSSDSSESL